MTSLVVQWSELLTTDHEVPGSIPGSTMGIFLVGGGSGQLVDLDLRQKPHLRGAKHQSTVTELTRSPRWRGPHHVREVYKLDSQTASTSAHRIPCTVIADKGEKNSGLFPSPLLRKSTDFITRAGGDMRSALFWDITQGRAVDFVPTFGDNMSVPSSGFKKQILFGLLDP